MHQKWYYQRRPARRGKAAFGLVGDQLFDFQHLSENFRKHCGIYYNISCPFVHVPVCTVSKACFCDKACPPAAFLLLFPQNAGPFADPAANSPCTKNNCTYINYITIPWFHLFVKGNLLFFLRKQNFFPFWCVRRLCRHPTESRIWFFQKKPFFSFFW